MCMFPQNRQHLLFGVLLEAIWKSCLHFEVVLHGKPGSDLYFGTTRRPIQRVFS